MSSSSSLRLPPAWLLVLCCAIGPVAMTMAVPANTQIMRDFATHYGVAQLILTVYLCAMAVSQLFLGALSDRLGRRPVMMFGLAIFVLGSLACALAPSLELLLAGRAIQGAGGAVGLTLSRAIVRDVYSREKSASVIAYISMAMVLAPMAGPVIGGLLTQQASWRWIFGALVVSITVVLIFVYRLLHETSMYARDDLSQTTEKPTFFNSANILLRNRAFVGYVVTTSFAAGMFFSFISGAPYLIMEVMRRSPAEYGAYFALSAVGYMLGNFCSGRFTQRLGPDRMMVLGLIPLGIGIAMMWALYGQMHPLALFVPMFFIAINNGFTIPNATASSLSIRPDLAGAASGISGSAQIGVGALLSMLVGFIQNGSYWPLLSVMTLSAALSVVGIVLALQAQPPSHTSHT